MHMRLDVGRRREGAAGINDRPGLQPLVITIAASRGRDHGDEPSLVHEQVAQPPVRVIREPDSANRKIDHRGQLSSCRPCGESQSAW